ncbi:MAG TPA: MFS transporter [Gammaproteobacteria bacterium]|nr:MFS transporter [Gammaproteobacteria bacterium]
MDIRQVIDHGRMTALQFRVVTICFFLNMLDGLDILSYANAQLTLSRDLSLDPQTMGAVGSAVLVGMMAGSIVTAPFADAIGRRKVLLVALSLIAAGMFGAAACGSVTELVVARFVTGCGIGGVVPAMAAFAAEFTPLRSRNFSVTLVQGGYTLGAALTGVVAAWLIPAFGWQSLFVLGGVLSIVGIVVVFAMLPESPDFLLGKRPAAALEQLNSTLGKMGHPALPALPAPVAAKVKHGGPLATLSTLFSSRYVQPTLLLWVAFFMSLAALYFLQTWVPQLVRNQGLTDAQAYWSGTILNAGLFVGMASVGWVADRFGLRRTIATYLGLAALVLLSFVYLTSTEVMLAGLGVLGVLQGGFIGLYAVGARLYPTEIRTTGIGWAMGVGRPGGAIAPWFVGLLVAAGLGMVGIFKVFALPLAIAAIAVFAMRSAELESATRAGVSASRTRASAARET